MIGRFLQNDNHNSQLVHNSEKKITKLLVRVLFDDRLKVRFEVVE
jgi:hypothetical protein